MFVIAFSKMEMTLTTCQHCVFGFMALLCAIPVGHPYPQVIIKGTYLSSYR